MPRFTELVVKARKKGVEKMLSDPDVVASRVALEMEERLNNDLSLLGFHGDLKNFSSTMENRKMTKLETMPNGKALVTMAKSYVKREWMLYGLRNLVSRNKIMCIKMLSGTLPHRVNLTRGRANRTEKLCRHCSGKAETDIHILTECINNQGLIIKRHDAICDKIAKEIKRSHPERGLQRERTWMIGLRQFRPDITMSDNDSVTFVDITCPYEKDPTVLEQREKAKCVKYAVLNHANLALPNVSNYNHVGFAFGVGGTINKATVENLVIMGFPKQKIAHLQMIAMNGSAEICNLHLRTKSGVG